MVEDRQIVRKLMGIIAPLFLLISSSGCGGTLTYEGEIQEGGGGPTIENPNPPAGGEASPSTPFASVGSFSAQSENYSLKGAAFHYSAYHAATEAHTLNLDPLVHLGAKEVEP